MRKQTRSVLVDESRSNWHKHAHGEVSDQDSEIVESLAPKLLARLREAERRVAELLTEN